MGFWKSLPARHWRAVRLGHEGCPGYGVGGALGRDAEVGKGEVVALTPVCQGLQCQSGLDPKQWEPWRVLSRGGQWERQGGSWGWLGAVAAARRRDRDCSPGSGGVRGAGQERGESIQAHPVWHLPPHEDLQHESLGQPPPPPKLQGHVCER